MTVIIVHGTIEIEDGRLDEAIELSLEHVRRSREEAGCISHNVHVDIENQNRLVFYETWSDMDALHTHFSVPASGEFVNKLGKLATNDSHMCVYESTKIR